MLRSLLIKASSIVKKILRKNGIKYSRPLRRFGKNIAVFVMAGVLAETMWAMLSI